MCVEKFANFKPIFLKNVVYIWLQYNIKKKEEVAEAAAADAVPDNPLMRKKKTPEELAKETEEADEDELTSIITTSLSIMISALMTIEIKPL